MVIAPALRIICLAFLVALIVRAVFSFIEPYPRNRIHLFAFQVTEPLIAPVRRLVPPIGGFDIAFMIVFIVVSFLLQLIPG
jgi:YggT family protein